MMNDRERLRAERWLRRHCVHGLELTPLVASRIALRHRTDRIEIAVSLALSVVIAVGVMAQATYARDAGIEQAAAWAVVPIGAIYLLMNVMAGAMRWVQRRDDQRIARGLRQRVTRAEAVRLGAILGVRNRWSMAVIYGGGILVGTAAAAAATATEDRVLAGVFVAGTTLFLGLNVWLLTDVIRRPAIADDEASLRADELLRRKDAGRTLMPYPPPLAAIAAVSSTPGSPLLWMFLTYAATAMVVWGLVAAPAVLARMAAGVRA